MTPAPAEVSPSSSSDSGEEEQASGTSASNDDSDAASPTESKPRPGFLRVPGLYGKGDGEYGHEEVVGLHRVPCLETVSYGKPLAPVLEHRLSVWQQQLKASWSRVVTEAMPDEAPDSPSVRAVLRDLSRCYQRAKAGVTTADGVADGGVVMRRFLLQLAELDLPFAHNHLIALFKSTLPSISSIQNNKTELLRLGSGSEYHCSECGRLGEVVACDTCSRVFHLACISGDSSLNAAALPSPWSCTSCTTASLAGSEAFQWSHRAGTGAFSILRTMAGALLFSLACAFVWCHESILAYV